MSDNCFDTAPSSAGSPPAAGTCAAAAGPKPAAVPEDDIGGLNLADIIDAPSVQSLMDDFYELAHIPMSIVDLEGNVLVGKGWQDICLEFHRVHPDTCRHCLESDTRLSKGIAAGEYKLYKCKNSMWDMATPIMVGGRHLGNLFMGQFFFVDEDLDYETFRAQARQYGFDEEKYIAALERVPRLDRKTVERGMAYLMKFAGLISKLSYGNIKLARSLAERDALAASLGESEERLNRAQEIAHLGSWELDLLDNRLTWSDEVYRIFGLQPQEFAATYEAFLDAVHPEDRDAVDAAYSGSLREGRDTYEIEHRVVRKSSGEVRIVHEKCEHFRDSCGKIVRSVGMVHDITERKRAEAELQKAHDELERKVEERAAELREKDKILLLQSRQAAMGEMIGNIAHQWRQPLNSLSLLIQTLPLLRERGELTREKIESMEISAMEIIQHMSQTIDDFRKYFKPDKEKAPFSIKRALARTLSLVGASFRNQQIDIEVNSIDDPVINGFQNEYSQVLLNVLLNARDAFEERKIADRRIVVTLGTENGKSFVTIADNAGGIPESIIDRIFDPYFTTKGPEAGTGVGLFMSKGIIEKNMGGMLTVRNAGGGAEFRIEV